MWHDKNTVSSRPFGVYEQLSTISTGKWSFWNKLITSWICKSKCVEINTQTYSDPFLQRIFFKKREVLKRASSSYFEEHFDFLKIVENILKIFCSDMTEIGRISFPNCVYFPRSSVKYVYCFLLSHLIML